MGVLKVRIDFGSAFFAGSHTYTGAFPTQNKYQKLLCTYSTISVRMFGNEMFVNGA